MSIPRGTQMEEEVSIPLSESEAIQWLAEDSYLRKRGLEPDDAAYSIAQTIIVSSFIQQQENIIDLLSNVTAWTSIINELNKIVNNNTLIVILGTRGKRYEFYPKEYLSEQMRTINTAMKKYSDNNPVPGKYSFEDFKKIYTKLLQGLVTAKPSSRLQRQTSNIHTLDDLKMIDKNAQLREKDLREHQDVLYKQQDQVKGRFNELQQKTENFNAQLNRFNQVVKDLSDITTLQTKYNDEHIRSTKLSSENEVLNAKLKTAQESIEQLQKDNEMLRNLMDQRKEEINAKMNEMSELKNAFDECKKEYEARISGQLPVNRQREQELLQERDAINARVGQLNFEIQQKTQEVLRLEQQLKTAQQQADFERIRAERAEKESKSTMSSYLNAREELGRLTGQIAGTRQQMTMQKDRIDELKFELGDVRAKTNAQQQKMMEMDEETTAYKVRTGIAEVREEMTRDQYNELKKDLQHKEEEMKHKEKEMNRMRDYILQLTHENATLIGKTEQLQYQLQEGINAFGRLQLDYKAVVEDKDKLLTENVELRREGNALVSNMHMLTYNAYTNGQATEVFTTRDLKERIKITEREREDYKEKTVKLESKLEKKKEKEEKKKKKRERTKVQVEQNEKELSQLRIEYALQKKENEHNREKIEEYKEKIEELEKHGALVPINQVIPSSAHEQDLANTFELRDFIREALEYTVGENNVNHREIYYGQLETYDSKDEMLKKYKGMVGSDSGKAYAQFNSDRSKYDAAFLGIDRWFGDTKSVIWVRVDQYINWDTKNKRKLVLQMEKLSYWNGIIESTKVPLLKDTEDLK